MPIIYADQIINGNGGPSNLTPAATYAGVTNFATLLDNIASGEIPSGSGQPFPVNWKSEPADDVPWFTNPTNASPFVKY